MPASQDPPRACLAPSTNRRRPSRWAALAILAALASSSPTHAALIGSFAEFAHVFGDRTDAQATARVEDGAGDLVNLVLGTASDGSVGYTINMDAAALYIDFYYPGPLSTRFNSAGAGGINGLVVSSPALDANRLIDTAEISQSGFRFSPSRFVLIDAHTIGFDFQLLDFSNQSRLAIAFSQPALASAPTTVWLTALGLALLFLTNVSGLSLPQLTRTVPPGTAVAGRRPPAPPPPTYASADAAQRQST